MIQDVGHSMGVTTGLVQSAFLEGDNRDVVCNGGNGDTVGIGDSGRCGDIGDTGDTEMAP